MDYHNDNDHDFSPDYAISSDEEFIRLAKSYQEESERARRLVGSKSAPSYEPIHYTALKTNIPSILRFVGEVPNSNKTPITSRIVRMSHILCDDGKERMFVLPKNPLSNYLLWNIINKVKQFEYAEDPQSKKKVKAYIYRDKYPEIYNLIEKNGRNKDVAGLTKKEADLKVLLYNYDRGWEGRDVFVANVIDRTQMDWHRENKSFFMLAKSARDWIPPTGGVEDKITFYEAGIPAYGFFDRLANEVLPAYGHFSKYDICIIKTGLKETPYRIFNATAESQKVLSQAHRELISKESFLTEEEKSWSGYNLDMIYRPTTYSKIKKYLRDKIEYIDSVLKTRFLTELNEGVEREERDSSASRLPFKVYSYGYEKKSLEEKKNDFSGDEHIPF